MNRLRNKQQLSRLFAYTQNCFRETYYRYFGDPKKGCIGQHVYIFHWETVFSRYSQVQINKESKIM